MSDWGKGALNNNIGWGQGFNNPIGWGAVYANSYNGQTVISEILNLQSIIDNFKTRVANDGGTFEAESNLLSILTSVNNNIGLSKVNMLLTPNAFKAGKAYNVIGPTDFAVLRNTDATRINSAGLVQLQGSNIMRIDYSSGTPIILDELQATNLVFPSKDFSSSAWGKLAVGLTTGQLDPQGNNTAILVTSQGFGGSAPILINPYNPSNVLTHGRQIWAKTTSGTGTTSLLAHNSNLNSRFTITNAWQKFTLKGFNSTGSDNIYAVDFRFGTLSQVLLWEAQAETGEPSSSIFTTNAAVTRNEDLLTVTPPAGTVRITTTFLDNTNQVLNTIPATFTLPTGRVRQVVFQNSL
jgi:hypothetical protein